MTSETTGMETLRFVAPWGMCDVRPRADIPKGFAQLGSVPVEGDPSNSAGLSDICSRYFGEGRRCAEVIWLRPADFGALRDAAPKQECVAPPPPEPVFEPEPRELEPEDLKRLSVVTNWLNGTICIMAGDKEVVSIQVVPKWDIEAQRLGDDSWKRNGEHMERAARDLCDAFEILRLPGGRPELRVLT